MIKQESRRAFAKNRKATGSHHPYYPVATIAARASVQPQILRAYQSWEDFLTFICR
jgi:hypothetical protein